MEELLRLWYHESQRVFQDRLVDDVDRDWFSGLLNKKIVSDFNAEFSQVITHEPLIYGDFMTANVDNKPYIEISDYDKVGTSPQRIVFNLFFIFFVTYNYYIY